MGGDHKMTEPFLNSKRCVRKSMRSPTYMKSFDQASKAPVIKSVASEFKT